MNECCKKMRAETINECVTLLLGIRGDDLDFQSAKDLTREIKRKRVIELRKQGYSLDKIRKLMGYKYINSVQFLIKKYG